MVTEAVGGRVAHPNKAITVAHANTGGFQRFGDMGQAAPESHQEFSRPRI
jgi:hypothetical protein